MNIRGKLWYGPSTREATEYGVYWDNSVTFRTFRDGQDGGSMNYVHELDEGETPEEYWGEHAIARRSAP